MKVFFLFHIIRHLSNITLYYFHIVSDWSPFNGNQPFVPEARLWITFLSYTFRSLPKHHVAGWCEATSHRETMWEMSPSGCWGHEKVKDKKKLGTPGKQIYIFPPIFFFLLCIRIHSVTPSQVIQMCPWLRAPWPQRRSRWRWLVSSACARSWCAASQSCASCESFLVWVFGTLNVIERHTDSISALSLTIPNAVLEWKKRFSVLPWHSGHWWCTSQTVKRCLHWSWFF